MTLCAILACGKPIYCRGFCRPHYNRDVKIRPAPKRLSALERFEAGYTPVPEAGCWLWKGPWDEDGYGLFGAVGSRFRAHKFSWETSFGPVPRGLCVCHHCDTPECVNPAHLFLGTSQENTADRDAKDRQIRGERVNTAKLAAEDVIRIRASCKSNSDLAYELGVDRQVIYRARVGKTWVHL